MSPTFVRRINSETLYSVDFFVLYNSCQLIRRDGIWYFLVRNTNCFYRFIWGFLNGISWGQASHPSNNKKVSLQKHLLEKFSSKGRYIFLIHYNFTIVKLLVLTVSNNTTWTLQTRFPPLDVIVLRPKLFKCEPEHFESSSIKESTTLIVVQYSEKSYILSTSISYCNYPNKCRIYVIIV